MKILGRIAVRRGRVAGLFTPFSDMEPGVYELREIMGEVCVKYLGAQAMDDARYNGLSVNELVQNPGAMMTAKEYVSVVTDKLNF